MGGKYEDRLRLIYVRFPRVLVKNHNDFRNESEVGDRLLISLWKFVLTFTVNEHYIDIWL